MKMFKSQKDVRIGVNYECKEKMDALNNSRFTDKQKNLTKTC